MDNELNNASDELDSASEMPADLPWQLLEEITNGFSEERKIGSGGYGVVYKGVYKNGEEIAVKKLYPMPGLDDKQFQNELQSLTRLRHQNIVRLVGKRYEERERCVEHEGKLVCAIVIDRVICLEYLHKGSLEKHLSDESSGLPWHMRYEIIKGICDGLAYLHGCQIFHLDLKPANILLDKNMVPKIADFGLSRLFSGTRQSHTTSKFLATIGYAPPEYIEKGKISDKFDIFSLGVIIIGIMTGPDGYSKLGDIGKSSQDFIEQVLEKWRNRPQTIVDFNVFCQVRICIEIALNCLETDRHKRPSIGDIISKLNETMIGESYKIDKLQSTFHRWDQTTSNTGEYAHLTKELLTNWESIEWQEELSERVNAPNGVQFDDRISLTLAAGGGGNEGSAPADGLNSQPQIPSKETGMKPLIDTASALPSTNNDRRSGANLNPRRIDNIFSHPRQPRSVRPRHYLSIDTDSE